MARVRRPRGPGDLPALILEIPSTGGRVGELFREGPIRLDLVPWPKDASEALKLTGVRYEGDRFGWAGERVSTMEEKRIVRVIHVVVAAIGAAVSTTS